MYERLGLSGRFLVNGVSNETAMVEMLTAMKTADTAGCFEQGVGNINNTTKKYRPGPVALKRFVYALINL